MDCIGILRSLMGKPQEMQCYISKLKPGLLIRNQSLSGNSLLRKKHLCLWPPGHSFQCHDFAEMVQVTVGVANGIRGSKCFRFQKISEKLRGYGREPPCPSVMERIHPDPLSRNINGNTRIGT